MSAQPLLLPSLYALLPSSSYQTITSHLSLQAIHVEPFSISESTYLPTSSVIPGQIRPLRLQATLKPSSRHSSDDKGKGRAVDDGPEWEYGLAYISAPLQGREYSEMSVRGFLGVEVSSKSGRKEIEDWVEALGYRYVHGPLAGQCAEKKIVTSTYADRTTLSPSVTRSWDYLTSQHNSPGFAFWSE